jgi:hypothetical protein
MSELPLTLLEDLRIDRNNPKANVVYEALVMCYMSFLWYWIGEKNESQASPVQAYFFVVPRADINQHRLGTVASGSDDCWMTGGVRVYACFYRGSCSLRI